MELSAQCDVDLNHAGTDSKLGTITLDLHTDGGVLCAVMLGHSDIFGDLDDHTIEALQDYVDANT